MVHIKLPPQQQALTSMITNCLSAAKQVGFAIEDIAISPGHCEYIAVIDQDQATCYSVLHDAVQDTLSINNADRYLLYLNGQPLPEILNDKTLYIDAYFEGELHDVWLNAEQEYRVLRSSHVIAPLHSERHLAWFFTCLSLEFSLQDALMLARAAMTVPLPHSSMNKLREPDSSVSRETWPTERFLFPTPLIMVNERSAKFNWNCIEKQWFDYQPIERDKFNLYPVVTHYRQIEKLLMLGVKTVQLRIKNPLQKDLEEQIKHAVALGEEHDAQVFINDYWQLAIKHQAYGVHLGQEDLQVADLKLIQQMGLRLGLSTHGYYEVLKAAQFNPSYIALGHIFPTPTKQMPSKPQGVIKLKLYQQMISSLMPHEPTVAIGGIDLSNAKQVWQCGVSSLAVVRAITEAPDIQLAINQFAQIMQEDLADVAEPA
ncbi:thiamine phosphate synthase [Vibrio sp. S11_S32]|uniref:thiamine phosphate synthase n=1 Tax=Vibrio sp. S11_S32 TaxID=2720225 RepID=UPI0016813853|nr:thiamine phosphate synthase [Vibrio sp. S11_S32]MBD1577284.1 thiamine phosphate synthase [Vibrio sp. S11_S32]